MQLLVPALLLGSFIQSSVALTYKFKTLTVTETEVVTKYKTTIKAPVKTVIYTKTIQKPPGLKDIEAYASYKGLTCIKAKSTKPSKTTKAPTTTDEAEGSWVKNCPASVTLTAVPKCPAIRCMADPICPVYDEAPPIEWDCRCKDRPPTTTKWVKPCPSCCPPAPIRRHEAACLGKMSKLPEKPMPTKKVKPIAVGEPNPAAPAEDEVIIDTPKAEPAKPTKKPTTKPAEPETDTGEEEEAPKEDTTEVEED